MSQMSEDSSPKAALPLRDVCMSLKLSCHLYSSPMAMNAFDLIQVRKISKLFFKKIKKEETHLLMYRKKLETLI